ncbi:MAG TPA: hypothetical protein GXZ30_13915 [Propionibacterium sp.]|jgi:hypothetical protein|nr:hypothetical protein [Propionibacterium sp.]
MSALPVVPPETSHHKPPASRTGRDRSRWLRLVPAPRPRLARLPFLTILLTIVGAGMVGLLLLNTSLQNQAFQASQLRREAAEMSYAVGELEQLLTEAESTRELSRRATALGMRPNRDIAFVEVPTGVISGEPRASDGLYLPSSLSLSPEEIARNREAQAVKRSDSRRKQEQETLDQHRQRIVDARAKELEERRKAAEEAAAQRRAADEAAAAQAAAGGQPEAPAAETGQTQPAEALAVAPVQAEPESAAAPPAEPTTNSATDSENR